MADRHYPSFSDATKCICGEPMKGHNPDRGPKKLSDMTITELQTGYYEAAEKIREGQERQRHICHEILMRVERAEQAA